MMRGHAQADRGSATIWMLTAALVVIVAGAAAVMLASVVLARHRAAAAADAAALAAAGRPLDPSAGCAAASRVAAADGGRLTACRVDAGAAVVTVEVRPSGRLGWLGAAVGRARAGPVFARSHDKQGHAPPAPMPS